MKIEAKPRTLVAIGIMIAIVVGGYFYMKKTKPKRVYMRELRMLRIVEEHQRLEIEVANQRAKIQAMKKAAEDAVPKMRLVPEEANQ